jgi:lipase
MSERKPPQILTAKLDDAEMQYLNYPGSGSVIILLHATGFLPWLWHPIVRLLSENCRIVVPYVCAHRPSDPHQGGLGWGRIADDIGQMCRVLDLERPSFVGHSMGGAVATLLEGLHGPIAEKLLLIEPIFLPQPIYSMEMTVEQHPLASKSIKRKAEFKDADEAREYLRGKDIFKDWNEEMLDLYIEYGMTGNESGGIKLACSPKREASLFMGSTEIDPWPLLPNLNCPVLILEGATSGNRDHIDLARAISLIPDCQYRLVEDAGHLIPMERPVLTAEIITSFLDCS